MKLLIIEIVLCCFTFVVTYSEVHGGGVQFPLLSKCLRLQKLCSESPESSSQHQIVQLPDFPGGVEAFELCAKFCYGISITLSPYNIVAARCGAEYLQMTEEVEKGNLIQKLEVFFNSCILLDFGIAITNLFEI